MRSFLIFSFFSLTGLLFQAEANLTFKDAVDYLLALADDTKQNRYNIGTDSVPFNHFNRNYEMLHGHSGVTGENGRPPLIEACQAVTANIQSFHQDSPLGKMMIEKYRPTRVSSIATIINTPEGSDNRRTNADKLVQALFKMDKLCEHLFSGQPAQFDDQALKGMFESLLEFDQASAAADNVQRVYMLYSMLNDPNDHALLVEACKRVTANINQFNANSLLGNMLMTKFGHPDLSKVKRNLRKIDYSKASPRTDAGNVGAALYKMDKMCAQLFSGPV